MRVEPYSVGSVLHVVKRGARGLNIVRDDADRWRFLKMLYLLNDSHFDKNWVYSKEAKKVFTRPVHWPRRQPIVCIHAFTLMPNHFHLLLGEVVEGGISLFMKRLGQSMTNYFNEKYHEKGSIFQGSYRSQTVDSDEYLRYVTVYILAKNTMELFPSGGLVQAQKDFDSAWEWGRSYKFSSLRDYATEEGNFTSPIVDPKLIQGIFSPKEFKQFSKDMLFSDKYEPERPVLEV